MSERDDMIGEPARREEPEADFDPADIPEDRIGDDPTPGAPDSDSEVQT